MLIVLAPIGLMNGYHLAVAAKQRPHIDFLTVSAIREVASGIAGILFAVLGANILHRAVTGELWLPPSASVTLLVMAVVLDRLPSIIRYRNIRSYSASRQDRADHPLRRMDDLP